MLLVLLIAAFGALGCVTRYFVGMGLRPARKRLPLRDLCGQYPGVFIIGLIMEFGMRSTVLPANLRTGLTIGFLGGLTTFSTFSYETFRLLEEGEFSLPRQTSCSVFLPVLSSPGLV